MAVYIYCDASVRPTSQTAGPIGPATCAAVIYNGSPSASSFVRSEGGRLEGSFTVPEAEFLGVILGLEHAAEFERQRVQVFGDNECVINALNGTWRMKKPHLRELFDICRSLQQRYASVSYQKVERIDRWQRHADSEAQRRFGSMDAPRLPRVALKYISTPNRRA